MGEPTLYADCRGNQLNSGWVVEGVLEVRLTTHTEPAVKVDPIRVDLAICGDEGDVFFGGGEGEDGMGEGGSLRCIETLLRPC